MSRNQRRKKRAKAANNQRASPNANRKDTRGPSAEAVHRRPSTETKASTKTTELYAYVLAVAAVVITAFVVGDGSGIGGDGNGDDPFGASEAIRYITFLTIGYMVARGLAKSGSRDFYDEHGN